MLKTGFGKKVHIRGFVNKPTICITCDKILAVVCIMLFNPFHTKTPEIMISSSLCNLKSLSLNIQIKGLQTENCPVLLFISNSIIKGYHTPVLVIIF